MKLRGDAAASVRFVTVTYPSVGWNHERGRVHAGPVGALHCPTKDAVGGSCVGDAASKTHAVATVKKGAPRCVTGCDA